MYLRVFVVPIKGLFNILQRIYSKRIYSLILNKLSLLVDQLEYYIQSELISRIFLDIILNIFVDEGSSSLQQSGDGGKTGKDKTDSGTNLKSLVIELDYVSSFY